MEKLFKIAIENEQFQDVKASNLFELKEKGILALKCQDSPNDYDVYLEDNTLVDDEEYFSFCESGTKFFLKFKKPCVTSATDIVDNTLLSLASPESQQFETDEAILDQIFLKLHRHNSITTIFAMNNDELYILSEQEADKLAERTGILEDQCDVYIDCASEELSKRIRFNDAIHLLKLYVECFKMEYE